MPHWPMRMKADLAAAYLGLSRTKFRAGVGEKYPKPVEDGSNVLWLKTDLDAWLEKEHGIAAPLDDFDQGTDNAMGKADAR